MKASPKFQFARPLSLAWGALLLTRLGSAAPIDANLGYPSFPAPPPSDDPPPLIHLATPMAHSDSKTDPTCGGACVPDCTEALAAKLHASCAEVYGDDSVYKDTDSSWQLISVDAKGRWVWYNPSKEKLKEKFRTLEAATSMEPALQKVWGRRTESLPKIIALMPWRLVVRPLVSSVATGTTAQRTLNTGRGLMKYVASLRGDKEARTKAGFLESDGLVNAGGTLNSLIDDTATLIKSPFFAGAGLSRRIEVCYANLQATASDKLARARFTDPELHVGIRVDNGLYESDDPAVTVGHLATAAKQGALFCHRVPLIRRESESIAIERLRCADSLYQPGWGPVLYNCAGYTADILKLAGLGYPGLPNMGIGHNLSISEARAKQFKYVTEACNARIEALRRALNALEHGDDITQLTLPATLPNSGTDARLQMILSAARNGNAANQSWVVANISEAQFNEAYLNVAGTKLQAATRNFVKQAAKGLPPAGVEWIKLKFPQTARILTLLR